MVCLWVYVYWTCVHYVCKHFRYDLVYTWPSCLQECMHADIRGWTGVQKRRRQWFWSIYCSCAKVKCWASTSTSTNLYVRYGTVGPSCWLLWAPLQIEEYSRSREAVLFLMLYSSTCRTHVVLLFNIHEFKFTLPNRQSFFSANISGYTIIIYVIGK